MKLHKACLIAVHIRCKHNDGISNSYNISDLVSAIGHYAGVHNRFSGFDFGFPVIERSRESVSESQAKSVKSSFGDDASGHCGAGGNLSRLKGHDDLSKIRPGIE